MEARFLTDLRAWRDTEEQRWILTQPLTFRDNQGTEHQAPMGFSTDLDSVPRIPIVYAYLKGRATNAAVIHDWLYEQRHPRKQADQIFLQAMKAEGIGWIRRRTIYGAVRAFGWMAY